MTAKKFTSAQLRKIARDALEYETSFKFTSFLLTDKKKQQVEMEVESTFGNSLHILAIVEGKSLTLTAGNPLTTLVKCSIFAANV